MILGKKNSKKKIISATITFILNLDDKDFREVAKETTASGVWAR